MEMVYHQFSSDNLLFQTTSPRERARHATAMGKTTTSSLMWDTMSRSWPRRWPVKWPRCSDCRVRKAELDPHLPHTGVNEPPVATLRAKIKGLAADIRFRTLTASWRWTNQRRSTILPGWRSSGHWTTDPSCSRTGPGSITCP